MLNVFVYFSICLTCLSAFGHSVSRCDLLLGRRGQVVQKNIFEKEDLHVYEVSGVPLNVELVQNPENQIFRHYSSPIIIKKISAEQIITAGPTPYVVKAGGSMTYFMDLTGVFLTKPNISANAVGVVKGNSDYIDIKLPPGTPLLKLEEGIYLIPGDAGVRPWLLEKYKEYLSSGVLKPEYKKIFLKWDQEGVPNALNVRVNLVK